MAGRVVLLCEHTFALTSKGSIHGQLQRAIDKGDANAVRSLAGELRHISLETAARITLMLLEQEPESFPAAARRLIARLASERDVELGDLVDVAATLDHLQHEPLDGRRRELFEILDAAPRRP